MPAARAAIITFPSPETLLTISARLDGAPPAASPTTPERRTKEPQSGGFATCVLE